MFLKKQTVAKHGKTYVYYRIVSSYRDETGRAKHRIEQHLGALSDEEAARIRAELRAGAGRADGGRAARRSAGSAAGRPSTGADSAARADDRAPKPSGIRPLPDGPTAELPEPPGPPALAAAFVFQGMHKLAYAPRSPKEWNRTDADMILLVREGRGELLMNGRTYALEAGAAFYCPAGSGMFVGNPHERTLLLDRVAFAALAPAPLAAAGSAAASPASYGRAPGPHWAEGGIPLTAPARTLQLTDELYEAASAGEPGHPLRTQLAFYQLLASLFKPLPVVRPAQAEPGGWIAAAVRFIHDHYGDNLSRGRLASQIGISQEHFSRLFRRETGLSFVDYLCKVRIRRSQELLQLAPAKQIGEIAKLTGFGSEHYFSRKFKQSTNYTPSAYRMKPKFYASLSGHISSCLLTLGVVPRLGVIEPWMKAAYGGTHDLSAMETVGDMDRSAVSSLAKAAPDLILAGTDSGQLETLRELGPLCPIPDADDDWRAPFFFLADAVGRRTEAEAWATGFNGKAAALREQLAPLRARNETAVIFKIVSDRIYVYGRATSMGGLILYDSLGLRPPAAVQRELIDRRLPNRAISPEELPLYAADHVFLFDYHTSWYPDDPAWMRSETWLNLDAVRRGRVHRPDSELFYGYDPRSLELQLTETARLLRSHADPSSVMNVHGRP